MATMQCSAVTKKTLALHKSLGKTKRLPRYRPQYERCQRDGIYLAEVFVNATDVALIALCQDHADAISEYEG